MRFDSAYAIGQEVWWVSRGKLVTGPVLGVRFDPSLTKVQSVVCSYLMERNTCWMEETEIFYSLEAGVQRLVDQTAGKGYAVTVKTRTVPQQEETPTLEEGFD